MSPGSLRIGLSPSSFKLYNKREKGGLVNFMVSHSHYQE